MSAFFLISGDYRLTMTATSTRVSRRREIGEYNVQVKEDTIESTWRSGRYDPTGWEQVPPLTNMAQMLRTNIQPTQQRWERLAPTLHPKKSHGGGDAEDHQASRCLSFC